MNIKGKMTAHFMAMFFLTLGINNSLKASKPVNFNPKQQEQMKTATQSPAQTPQAQFISPQQLLESYKKDQAQIVQNFIKMLNKQMTDELTKHSVDKNENRAIMARFNLENAVRGTLRLMTFEKLAELGLTLYPLAERERIKQFFTSPFNTLNPGAFFRYEGIDSTFYYMIKDYIQSSATKLKMSHPILSTKTDSSTAQTKHELNILLATLQTLSTGNNKKHIDAELDYLENLIKAFNG